MRSTGDGDRRRACSSDRRRLRSSTEAPGRLRHAQSGNGGSISWFGSEKRDWRSLGGRLDGSRERSLLAIGPNVRTTIFETMHKYCTKLDSRQTYTRCSSTYHNCKKIHLVPNQAERERRKSALIECRTSI